MGNLLKAAVVGTGFIGPVHVEAIRRTNLAEVAAVVGRTEENVKRMAEEYNIPSYYTDYDRFLQESDAEVVHICTPNVFHYEQAKKALLAGKHVICEKPLSFTSAQAKELEILAAERNLVHALNFNIRYYPLIHHAKEMIERGELGDIYAVTGSYLQDWLFYDTDYSWRLETDVSGETRAIGDIGYHWMDLLEYVTGLQVQEVMADFATFHETRKKPKTAVQTFSGKTIAPSDYEAVSIHTEDYATVLLHFQGRTKGIFTVNQMAAGHKNRLTFEINGSKGSLSWNSERPNELELGYRDKGNVTILKDASLMHESARAITSYPGGHNEGFADINKQLLKDVYRHIQDRREPQTFPTFQDGVRSMKLCEAIVASQKKRCWKQVEA